LREHQQEPEHKVSSTPTLIIGAAVLRDVRGFEEIVAAIDAMLARR
jgi:hypothetical protein